MKKICISIAMVAFWAVMYSGVTGNFYAWNAFRFVAWLTLLMALVLATISIAKPESMPKRKSFSIGLGAVSDISMALCLAAYGHFFYAGLITFTQLLELFAFAPDPRLSATQRRGN